MPDEGAPISYEVLERDTPVYSADGMTVGKVEVVRADLEADIFDGLEIDTRHGRRFVDADQVAAIRERGVDLKLNAADVENLPRPDPVPPAYRADPAAAWPAHARLGHVRVRRRRAGIATEASLSAQIRP